MKMEDRPIVIMLTEDLFFNGSDSKHNKYFFSRSKGSAKKFKNKKEAEEMQKELGIGFISEYVKGGDIDE